MEPTDKRSVGCEDDSADCRFLENDLREWNRGGGGNVSLSWRGTQKSSEKTNKQKKQKNCQSRVFIGTDSADRSF